MIKFEKNTPENWDLTIGDASQTAEFAKASKNEGDVLYASDGKSKAVVIIKKKYIKAFSRAQIFTSSEDAGFLTELLEELKQRKVPYARIGSTMFGISKKIDIEKSEIIQRNTFVIGLDKKEQEIWENFDKKLRNSIRKAEKEGVRVEELKENEMEDYYNLSLKTQQDIQNNKGKKTFSIPEMDFFKEVYENKIGRFLVAKFDGKIIAGALFLIWGGKSVYYQSCSDREFRDKQAPSLIQWEAIKLFQKEGVKEYDLGGVTLGLDKSDSRFFVYEFKRKFNGELREFYNMEFELSKYKKLQDRIIKRIYG